MRRSWNCLSFTRALFPGDLGERLSTRFPPDDGDNLLVKTGTAVFPGASAVAPPRLLALVERPRSSPLWSLPRPLLQS